MKKIHDAIRHPKVTPDSSEGWEGNVLNTLGIKWENRNPGGSGYYMRGFIQDCENIEFDSENDDVLSFYAEEAWGLTDFYKGLERGFPDIKVYYCVVEEGVEIYATNDKEGKYFPYRWHVELSIDGNIQYEEFIDEESMYEWLSDKTNGRIKNLQDAEAFNSDYEDACTDDENYIRINEYEVID